MQEQGLDPRESQMDLMEFMDKRIAAYERATVPDDKDLLEILSRRSFDREPFQMKYESLLRK